MDSFEKAFKEVKTLVKNFKDNERYYLSPSYSEIDARRDFIDKFFEALGWDVYHNTQKNPYEQEVRVEKNVAVGKAQKRADYSFCISPNYRDTKFYVEAKKPLKNLYNPDYYFQAIRYGWNANTPIVILTDFEEFHIIDSRFKPDIKTALDRQIERYHYSEYTDKEKLSRIYYLLSHEAVEDNSIEKRADELPKPRGKAVKKGLFKGGYQSIDESFLKELDDIRITLAKIFKKNNQGLTSEELTEATQRTIDRLVFIRFLEDKLIEGEHYVSEFGGKNSVWKDFIATSKRFDVKYNGIVFKNHPIIDSPDFKEADDIYFGKICEDLSYENTPYDFNAIPIHILGSIYERFLGKIIHATNKQVRIEEKPEVRKAGGVYYTPQYIVKYIVDNTVGKLVGNKTPKDISKLRFADIACGSGSFLITVYDTLLHYVGKWYQEHPEQAKKDGCIYKDGQWVLSLKQKQEILLNNIYGVDIDYQAVEVTQLSLFLKLLEDETTATANDMQVLFKEKILPDLSKNIVCGNSLIGTDIYDGSMFPSDEQRKINAMNFEDVFPEIMKNGGFDAVVGNPPYVRVDTLEETQKEYILDNFLSAKGKYDLYYLFVEKAFNLINPSGNLSYIIPNRFTTSDSGFQLRKLLVENANSIFINSLSKIRVFKNAATYPNIINIKGKAKGVKELIINESASNEELYFIENQINIKSKEIKKLPNLIFPLNSNKAIIDLYFRLIDNCLLTENIFKIQEGLRLPKDIEKEKGDFHIVKQYQFSRYSHITTGSFVDRQKLFKSVNPKSERFVNCKKPKLIFAEDALKIEAVIDLSESICQGGVYFATLLNDVNFDLKYLLALYNSKLLTKIYENLFAGMHMGGGYLRFRTSFLNKLPIKDINIQNIREKQSHDKLIKHVDQMLEARKLLQKAKTDKDKTYYERRCETLDRQIDQLVYELYGLTEEEVKIVEGV